MTFPVVSSWCSKHHIMVVFGKGGSQTLLARSKHLMASGSALAEVPVTSVLVRGCVNGQVLTQDVTAPGDVTGLLKGVHKQAPLIAMSTCLKLQNMHFSSYFDNRRRHQGRLILLLGMMVRHPVWLTTIFPPGPWLSTVTPIHWSSLFSIRTSSFKM